ncbi:MAG TPA: hypothetical protein VG097_01180 [Gemmata sp.]|jgi:hypothetical protein|nr:hypothetical protein [Gemmata sp.]
MANWEKTIIPLDDAHEVLSAFGIGSSSRQYQRWRQDDGFRHVDFEGVLNESSSVLVVDCRQCLQDAVDVILRQLGELGIEAAADLGEEGNEGVLQIEEQSARIKFIPNDEDDFDQVIAVINRLIAQKAHFRKFRSCEGSDGWSYAVLSNKDWQALSSSAGSTVELLFV